MGGISSDDGIRRWRVGDGEEVGKQAGVTVYAISVSRNDMWIVCGTEKGASVWDGGMHNKVIEVEEEAGAVEAVDVAPDSTRFATGTRAGKASVWSIATGERLVGPLEHAHFVNGVRFSPNGGRLATACYGGSIHIFDSHTGDDLVTIMIDIRTWSPATSLAWSLDGQQIFAVSTNNNIRAFNTSTGSQLAGLQIVHDGEDDVHSIALAPNNKFIATFANHSISFLDTSTLTRIGPVIEDSEQIRSIAISADSNQLATGRTDGKIIIRDLSKILPDLFGPFHVSCDLDMSNNSHTAINYIGTYSRATTEGRA